MDKLSLLANAVRQHEDDIMKNIKAEVPFKNTKSEVKKRIRTMRMQNGKQNENMMKMPDQNKGTREKYRSEVINAEFQRGTDIDGVSHLRRERIALENGVEPKANFMEIISMKTCHAKEEEKKDKKMEQFNKVDIVTKEDQNTKKDWEMAETSTGRYYLDFKSSYFSINEKIRILEAALEDIRERYLDTKDEYSKFNRKYSKIRKKRRTRATK